MKNKKGTTSIATKLVSVIIPVVLVAFIFILLLIGMRGGMVINDMMESSLKKEAESDAHMIEIQLQETFGYMTATANALSTVNFAGDQAYLNFFKGTLNHSSMIPSGIYAGCSDRAFYEPSGWNPGPDYNVLEKDWYKQAVANPGVIMHYDVPYFDSSTGDLCDTVILGVSLTDGREAAVCADVMLTGVKDYIDQIQIFGTGKGMLITSQGQILAYENMDTIGNYITDYPDDKFLQSVGAALPGGEEKLLTLQGNKDTYYAVAHDVDATDWIFVAYAPKSDIMKDINSLIIVIVVLSTLGIIGISLIIRLLVVKMVRKPVSALTANIEKITDGDFTVTIDDKGNDEIANMNRSMKTFVNHMNDTLRTLQSVSANLTNEVESSKQASKQLESEAAQQSESMEQIRDNMENMAQAVNDVAVNATELAQTFSDLMEDEQATQKTMNLLVEQAHEEQKDMSQVKDRMNTIASSMEDMGQAVKGVDEAARKINEIIDLINSIASQTNLLSLNASIEAARAGEAGKGFAVVATEIGQLASNSADATTQIADIIKDMTAKVTELSRKSESNIKMIGESAGAVETAADSFQRIYEDLTRTNDVMSEMADKMTTINDVATNMASLAEEQGASTEEVSATVDTLAESSKKVAESSENVAKTSSTVADAAENINEEVKQFTI